MSIDPNNLPGTLMKLGDNNYKLYIDRIPFATVSDSPYNKLSLKNCEAIANGYDLEDLSLRYCDSRFNLDPCTVQTFERLHRETFEAGFKKSLEILGDKKFSEEDIKKALEFDKFENEFNNKFYESQESFIQSLQQTEWKVEVIMECSIGCPHFKLNGEKSVCCGGKTPRLDSDGCVILKRL